MKIKCILACLIISLLVQNVSAQVFNILPYPNKLETTTKGQFDLNTTIEIASAITDPMVTPTIQVLKENLNQYRKTSSNRKTKFEIYLDNSITNKEGYTLSIASNKIILKIYTNCMPKKASYFTSCINFFTNGEIKIKINPAINA